MIFHLNNNPPYLISLERCFYSQAIPYSLIIVNYLIYSLFDNLITFSIKRRRKT
jgi:hypothetical protein